MRFFLPRETQAPSSESLEPETIEPVPFHWFIPFVRYKQAPVHTCHARDCMVETPPSMFMCKRHWYTLPKFMRDELWNAYRRGQEVDKSPSPEYLSIALRCVAWIAARENKAEKLYNPIKLRWETTLGDPINVEDYPSSANTRTR